MPKKKNAVLTDYLPPQNTEAEKALLASMLLEEEALIKGFEGVKKEFFYDLRHQTIFESAQNLFEKNRKSRPCP